VTNKKQDKYGTKKGLGGKKLTKKEEEEWEQRLKQLPAIIGEDNVSRLKNQKEELDDLRAEIDYLEKQKALYQVQTETLRQEYLKHFNKKEEFKAELLDVKKKNIKVERKIMDVEITIEGMMDMLEGNEGKKTNVRVMNPKLRKKLMEEQKKRQREMLQKKMAAGVDFLGDANVKLSKQDINKNII
jgi:chromosome segregation ATPase